MIILTWSKIYCEQYEKKVTVIQCYLMSYPISKYCEQQQTSSKGATDVVSHKNTRNTKVLHQHFSGPLSHHSHVGYFQGLYRKLVLYLVQLN